MKVKAVISAALLCAFWAISASGCDGADIGTDNLIRPPKTVGDERKSNSLLPTPQVADTPLKYPKSGNYRSAIVRKTLTMTVPTKQLLFTARLTKPKRKCICL